MKGRKKLGIYILLQVLHIVVSFFSIPFLLAFARSMEKKNRHHVFISFVHYLAFFAPFHLTG